MLRERGARPWGPKRVAHSRPARRSYNHPMALHLVSILHLAGLGLALFLIALLLHRRWRTRPNLLLGALLASLAGALWEGWMHSSGLWRSMPQLTGWFAVTPMLFGPLLYAYVRALSGHAAWSWRLWALHLGPAVLLLLLLLPLLLEPADQRLVRLLHAESRPSPSHPLTWLLAAVRSLHLLTYLIFAIWLLRRHEQHWREHESDAALLRLRWLGMLCAGLAAFLVLACMLVVLSRLAVLPPGLHIDDIALLVISLMVILIGYWGLTTPTLLGVEPSGEAAGPAKYAKSGLGPDSGRALADEILQALKTRALYRRPGLRLAELAEAVGISPHLVSQAINEHLAEGFFELVNRMRAEAAAQALADPKRSSQSIERIGSNAGFNNRASFARVFRQHYGTTPSGYRKARASAM